MLLMLATGIIRQSWNLGVSFLCFWLFLELLTEGIDSIIWSDNADLKLYVYCDIGELSSVASVLSTDGRH
jgi:hypothetical protein